MNVAHPVTHTHDAVFVVTSHADSRLVRAKMTTFARPVRPPRLKPRQRPAYSIGGDNVGARVESSRLLLARMEGENEGDGEAPGDLEAPLLDASRIEDDIQEEEPTAVSQAPSPSRTRFLADDGREEEPTAVSQAMSSALGHDLTPSQTRFLLTGSFIDILTNVSVSFIFPFLPTMLENAGAGPYQRGLIFAALPFGVLLVSPLVPPLLWRFGTKAALISSLVLITACLSLATYAGPPRGDTKLTDRALTRCVTIWVCSRLFMGFAVAGTGVTVLCLMTRHLPRRSHVFANGVLESAIGVGYMVGPAFGGWLFELFRWSEVPLIVNATATALLIPLVANMRLEDEEEDDEEEGAGGNTADQEGGEDKRGTVGMTMRLFARPRFFAAVLVLLAVSISFGVFPSTLPPHLQRTLKIGEGSVGTVYAGIAGLYAFFTPFVGPLAENGGITNPLGAMAVCGALLMAVAHLCFGPSPLLPMRFDGPRDWRLWAVDIIGGGVCYGIGSAFGFVPLLPLMQAAVVDMGPRYMEMTAGLSNAVYYSGELVGQLFGAQIVSSAGFPWASTAFGGMLVGACALFGLVRLVVKPPATVIATLEAERVEYEELLLSRSGTPNLEDSEGEI